MGVSTTALKVAQLIAARGLRVALFDATGRGDLYIMLGAEPTESLGWKGSRQRWWSLHSTLER